MREKRLFTLFLLNIRYFFLILNEPTGPHQHTDEHQLEASASFTSFSRSLPSVLVLAHDFELDLVATTVVSVRRDALHADVHDRATRLLVKLAKNFRHVADDLHWQLQGAQNLDEIGLSATVRLERVIGRLLLQMIERVQLGIGEHGVRPARDDKSPAIFLNHHVGILHAAVKPHCRANVIDEVDLRAKRV
jgi:hypothetical protein